MGKCDTPVTYSAEEAELVRRLVLSGTPDPACPRCGHLLGVSKVIEWHDQRIREVFCGECHRCVVVRIHPNDAPAAR